VSFHNVSNFLKSHHKELSSVPFHNVPTFLKNYKFQKLLFGEFNIKRPAYPSVYKKLTSILHQI